MSPTAMELEQQDAATQELQEEGEAEEADGIDPDNMGYEVCVRVCVRHCVSVSARVCQCV